MKGTIPVFFACDDAFVKFTIVAITSLKANASKDYNYDIHILYTKMSREMEQKTMDLADDIFHIEFNDVSDYLKSIEYKLPLRDYYSKTTYFRLFISEMFPHYDKAIYLDSDMIIRGDISELYNHDLGENYVGACNEMAMVQTECFGNYVEQCIGLDRNYYFNAGMLVINCDQFRKQNVLEQFIKLLHEYNFVVTQDEDYLNFICKDKILWIDNRWDYEVIFKYDYKPEEIKLLHYLMVGKPWHYEDCPHSNFFWEYAKQTVVYEEIMDELKNYPEEAKQRDKAGAERLAKTAVEEANRPDNFIRRRQKLAESAVYPFPKAGENADKNRLEIIEKIRQYEESGRFDEDVEEDPPSRPLNPGEVDFERKKILSKIQAHFAFNAARKFIKKITREKQLIIKDIIGAENLSGISGGAVLTCNHFNAFDSFAIQYVYDEFKKTHKKSRFFRIIREGNYTNFPGFYGYIMKHCNTLPLGSTHKVINEFMTATNNLLKQGNMVLIYPEQGMWWNYRKPRPVKKGAYTIANKANVPVVPVFMALSDSDIVGSDGFYVQEYTIIIGKPIYPNKEVDRQESIRLMMKENYNWWKQAYEDFYKIPLQYN